MTEPRDAGSEELRERLTAVAASLRGRPIPLPVPVCETVATLLDDARAALAGVQSSPRTRQALDALEFAAGAIWDALGEDGLDGRAGAAVLALIDSALAAHGRQRTERPQHDADVAWFRRYLEARLRALDAGASSPPADHCSTCGHPLSTHDAGPSEDGCRFLFGWGDKCTCWWPVSPAPPAALTPTEPQP